MPVDAGHESPAILALGETMAAVVPFAGETAATAVGFVVEPAGAESNVASTAAQLGVRAAWASRVGDDAFGERLRRSVAARSVDVSRVITDPARPTGVMVKDPQPQGSAVTYYRRGSAAAAMSISDADAMFAGVGDETLVHLSGVTPALSASCAALVQWLLQSRSYGGLRSFDVNFRPRLWSARAAASEMARLARASDICFVGLDEAEPLWGTATPDAVHRLLSDVPQLVVKDGARGVTVYATGQRLFVPSLQVDVVEPVGAGDAFAGGYLAAIVKGADPRTAARVGHLAAARVLLTFADVVAQPPIEELWHLSVLADKEWAEYAQRPASVGERDD